MRTEHRMICALAALYLGTILALAGCGAGAAATGGPSAVATVTSVRVTSATVLTQSASSTGMASLVATLPVPPGPLHPAGTLTNADSGKTVHFKVGDTIDVALKAASDFQNWEVATPDVTVLIPTVNPAAAAVRGATLRAFQAIGAGQTDITATSKPTCLAGQACPQLVQAFRVTVVIGG